MKKSRTDHAQLTLQLTFNNPTPAVLREISTLLEIADSSEVGGDAVGIFHPEGHASDACNQNITEEQAPVRKRLRQLAGCIAIANKQDWHSVWVLAYHRFFRLTGRHPVSESIRLGLPTHLDFVFTDPSWPGVLHNVLEEMLVAQNTTPT
jgi:hypothetical protein